VIVKEVFRLLEEIKRYVSYWESQPESREKGQEEFAVNLHKKTIALLQSNAVIERQTAIKIDIILHTAGEDLEQEMIGSELSRLATVSP
jgi:hypothetical protein